MKWRIRIIWIVHAREGFALNYPGNCFDSPFYFVKVDMAFECLKLILSKLISNFNFQNMKNALDCFPFLSSYFLLSQSLLAIQAL